MARIDVRASTQVAVAPEAVWALVSDTSRYAEWVVDTDAVTRSDGPARAGGTYAERNPIIGPWKARTEWEVIEFDAPRRQVHRTGDIPFADEFLVIMEVSPTGDGSEIAITLQSAAPRNKLGAALFRVLEGQTRRNNEKTVQNLARLAQAEA